MARQRQFQRRLSRAEMDRAMEDYVAGLSTLAVGRKYGINPQTVLNNLRARGITPRPASSAAIAGKDLDRVVELRAEGWSYAQIGTKFGVTGMTVRSGIGRPSKSESGARDEASKTESRR